MILFGVKGKQNTRYCNEHCAQYDPLVQIARQIPDHEVASTARHIHQGRCPSCHGEGPVDTHRSYRAWSAILVSTWTTHNHICCRKCGTRQIQKSMLFTFLLGWWGVHGIATPPMQLIQNLLSLLRPPAPDAPSPALQHQMRILLASQQPAPENGAGPEAAAFQKTLL